MTVALQPALFADMPRTLDAPPLRIPAGLVQTDKAVEMREAA